MAWVMKFKVPFLKFHFGYDTLTVLLTAVTPGYDTLTVLLTAVTPGYDTLTVLLTVVTPR